MNSRFFRSLAALALLVGANAFGDYVAGTSVTNEYEVAQSRPTPTDAGEGMALARVTPGSGIFSSSTQFNQVITGIEVTIATPQLPDGGFNPLEGGTMPFSRK